jgi:type IV secretory pathway VirB6-like protein
MKMLALMWLILFPFTVFIGMAKGIADGWLDALLSSAVITTIVIVTVGILLFLAESAGMFRGLDLFGVV